jgi:cell division septal protein FtsQ
MVPRLVLGLPRLPALTFRRPSVSSRRALAVVGGLVAASSVAYAAARETSLFAVRTIEVSGAPPEVAGEIRAALQDLRGESLVAIDPDDVRALLLELPSVRLAFVDRSFPHRLVITVTPERPLALLRAGSEGWVVSADGRVLREVESRALSGLPRIRLASGRSLRPGERVGDPPVALALRLLRAMPSGFPVRVLSAEAREGEVSLVVEGWVRIRLGRPVDLAAKLAAAAAVLRTIPPEERAVLGYLDASVAERVVAADKSQLEREG